MNDYTGLVTLCKREIRRYWSVASQTLLPPLISSSLFMLIFGMSLGRNIDLYDQNLSYLDFLVPGLITMNLISSSYENTSSSLFISRWHNHIQEMLLSPLSYFEMVLGLLCGGVTRGILTAFGVYLVSHLFTSTPVMHPWLLLYFLVGISIIFSSAGLLAALWAEDFAMLSVWSTYLIMPMVYLGGVFNTIDMIPVGLRWMATFNPMRYLINGVRYSFVDRIDSPLIYSVVLTFVLAVGMFLFIIHLFRIGYKLRT